MKEQAGSTNWLSWVVFVGGLWLIGAPFVIGFSDLSVATTNSILVGVIVAVLAFISAVRPRSFAPFFSWLLVLAGIWQILAPFTLEYTSSMTAAVNDVVLGVFIALLAMIRALTIPGTEYRTEYGQYGTAYYSEERPRRKKERKDEKKGGIFK